MWSAGVSVAHAREVEDDSANTSLNVYMNMRQHGERRTAKEVGHDHPEALRGVLIREKPRVHELPTKDVRADDDDALRGLVARRIRVNVRDLDLGALWRAVAVHEAGDAVGAGHVPSAIGRLTRRQEGGTGRASRDGDGQSRLRGRGIQVLTDVGINVRARSLGASMAGSKTSHASQRMSGNRFAKPGSMLGYAARGRILLHFGKGDMD